MSSGDGGGGGVGVAAGTASFLAVFFFGAAFAWANAAGASASAQRSAADIRTTRFIDPPPGAVAADYRPLHLPVPVLRFGVGRAEDLQVPFAAAPRLDDLCRPDVHEDLGERPPLGVPDQWACG